MISYKLVIRFNDVGKNHPLLYSVLHLIPLFGNNTYEGHRTLQEHPQVSPLVPSRTTNPLVLLIICGLKDSSILVDTCLYRKDVKRQDRHFSL